MRSGIFGYVVFIFWLMAAPVLAVVEVHEHNFFNPPDVKAGSVLSVEDCVSLAYKNSPKVKRKKYELDIAKSEVKIAKSAYFPVLSAGVGFNYERNSNSIYYDKKYRDLPNVALALNKMIWDFGKTTARVKMEEFYKIAAEYEFTDELCRTLFDIKAKYYKLLECIELSKVSEENVKLNEQFVAFSHGKLDKTTAKVYLTSAQARHINNEGNVDIAKYDLANAMYLDKHIDFKIKNTPTFLEYSEKEEFEPVKFPFSNEQAPEIAYKNSPDLAVLENTKEAMVQALKYAKKSYMPELSAGVGYGLNNTNFATNNSLQVGVNLESDVNLMELKYDIKEAKSELDIANNEILLYKKELYYEVLRALSNVECYEAQISALKSEVSQTISNLKLAIERYKAQDLDYTALQDAREDYISAKRKYVECLYNYNMAIIQTEMAMHYHIVDIHHKAEHALHHHSHELIEHLNDVLNCDENEHKTKRKNK